jgi:hypothetical protein
MLQRLTVVTVAGNSAVAIIERFNQLRSVPDAELLDQLCETVRNECVSLPIIYFTEWLDRWSMGNLVPGPGAVEGGRFQATTLAPGEALAWADQCGRQHQEQEWFAARLREAATAWEGMAEQYVVIVVREVIGGSTTDGELRDSFSRVPAWLS